MNNELLLEIGVEELPARFINHAANQLVQNSKKWFEENRIQFENITSYSTPRRLAIVVEGIATSQETLEEEVRGPSEKIAKNEDGSWSKAAIGFAKGQGKDLEDLYIKDIKGTPYVFVKKITTGQNTEEILPNIKEVITSIQFPQTMYWNRDFIPYARPIRWIVALYKEQIIPFEIAQVKSDRITYGHRFLGEKISISNPRQYNEELKQQFVIANAKKRKQMIIKGMKALEKEHGFYIYENDELLDEVTNLVEYPTVFYGSFDEQFLTLPEEVLMTAMEEHQRYFSVKSKEGKLLPYFVAVRNGDENYIENVRKGNEKVLSARLADSRFFYDEDLKHPLTHYVDKLENVVFQEQLGTYAEKINRTKNIATQIAMEINMSSDELTKLTRAAELCKFDLVTLMVDEFPELQGVIGEKYALLKGEDQFVAEAIKEHYYPLKSNGKLPTKELSAVLSVADKLDTIVGIISVGLTPTGSQDPYALRRQATGVLRILQDKKWDITVEKLIEITLQQFDVKIDEENILDFFKLRAEHILKDLTIEQDVINSVLARGIGHFPYTIEKATILSRMRNNPEFKSTEEALVRVLNITKNNEKNAIDENLFQTESEKSLYQKVISVSDLYEQAKNNYDAEKALESLSELTDYIDEFFEHNLVMDQNELVKNNRLALLSLIANLVNDYADLTEIQWKQQTN